jgi:hypothetical protein
MTEAATSSRGGIKLLADDLVDLEWWPGTWKQCDKPNSG